MSTQSTAAAGVQAVALPLVTPEREAGERVPGRVMLARVGTWLGHPTMPEVVEREHLMSALDYFNRHHAAHGADLVIDYHHASVVAPTGGTTAPAAGWVRGMELRADGTELWGEALWTAEAAAAIAARRYRYLSPVFRFNAPDRVTGEAVPMYIHSVALTNTPFLTELESLNEASAMDGGGEPSASEGGERMSLLDGLAEALGREPQDVASRLGVQADADQKEIAKVVLANANAAAEPTRGAGRPEPVVTPTVANALGVPAEADETAVKAAIIRLKAPGGGLKAVRRALELPEDAPEAEVLNSIAALREDRRREEAERLVDEAVEEGRIPPAHRDFYLREATNHPEAARQVINALPTVTAPQSVPDGEPVRGLADAEESVCRQLGISAEAFLAAAD